MYLDVVQIPTHEVAILKVFGPFNSTVKHKILGRGWVKGCTVQKHVVLKN